jgi:hypothetical protein
MRKILVCLLVIGLMIGTFTAVTALDEKNLSQDTFSLDEEDFTDTSEDPLPCGGGGDGAGGGAPG